MRTSDRARPAAGRAGMTRRSVASAAAALVLAAGLAAAPVVRAQDAADHLISYEALPSVGVDVDFAPASYAERAEITAEAEATIVPEVFALLDMDPAAAETQVTPGGYLLNTNASLQTRLDVSAEDADRFAAAVGYVFSQWSVLVTDFAAADGGTGYAVVDFSDGTLDADLAQAFFEHAAGVAEGLGGGYTAFGDSMYFLNVRGDDGPYSGLEDPDFIAQLRASAQGFEPAEATVAESGAVEARFVGNDWDGAPEGGDYLAVLGGPDTPVAAALADLAATWNARILDIAAEKGW
ncbi:MAG: hypothetical protein RID91_18900 [Azospirillaceae bacterium]